MESRQERGEELGGKRERDRGGEAKEEYPYDSLSKCSQKQRAQNTMQTSHVGGKNLFICTITSVFLGACYHEAGIRKKSWNSNVGTDTGCTFSNSFSVTTPNIHPNPSHFKKPDDIPPEF